jgi:hypothetical protein
MFDFNFPLFPFDSAAITVTTTVWIGVWVIVFFNLRLGWTLSGLVVPGYLVPLLITRPTTAAVVLFEAVLTYLIVRAMSDWPKLASFWSSFFGRDRFFVIVVVSVLVRAILDGWLLPILGQFLVEEIGMQFDYRNSLHSFGLIVVALIANYFWKPGLKGGIIPIATSLVLTYLIVTFVFVGLTNFNLGNFHLLYEDVSTSLLASPKAYIIVITTAYLASWINLRYAWDFNGILIPALLGLLWHDPFKIVISILECGVLFYAGSYLLKSPLFQNKTMEGGRKLLFFFTICFLYRLLLCHLLPKIFPGVALSDTFGFGYMLTTLMAVKAHDKKVTIRMLRGTVQVSMLGAVAGSLIGFAFFCGPPISFSSGSASTNALDDSAPAIMYTQEPLIELIRRDKVRLYEKRIPESYTAPTANELSLFRSILLDLKQAEPTDDDSLNRIANRLGSVNYRLKQVSNRYLYLHEKKQTHGWGVFIIDTQNPDGLCLEVPSPLDEWATIETGLCLIRKYSCAGLAIAGTPRNINIGGEADVLSGKPTMFSVFHEVFGNSQPLQLRGFTRSLLRKNKSAGIAGIAPNSKLADVQSQLWVRDSLPNSLNLAKLKNLIGGFDIHWRSSPESNSLRDSSPGRFAELVLNRQDRRTMVAYTILDESETQAGNRFDFQPIQQPLSTFLRQAKLIIRKQGSEGYLPASTEQMLYMDQEVVSPLMELASQIEPETSGSPLPFWKQNNIAEHLKSIDATARVLGYHLQIVSDPETEESFIALTEADPQSPRGWGIFIFRPGLASPFVVEIPRPLFEYRSFDFGINLFDRTQASIMLIAGSHPRANQDGTADISRTSNKTNLFNLCRHVMFRQLGNRPQLIIQARAIQAPVDADIVIATDDGTEVAEQLTPIKKKLLAKFNEDQMRFTFVDGRETTAGYEIGILMQAAAVQVSENKEVISLWLSPSLRSKFREQANDNTLSAQFDACKVLTKNCSLWNGITAGNQPKQANQIHLPVALRDAIESYVQSYDVVQLYSIVNRFQDWNFTRILDDASAQAFLLVSNNNGQHPAIVNLTGAVGDQTFQTENMDIDSVSQFVRSRALWLEVGSQ